MSLQSNRHTHKHPRGQRRHKRRNSLATIWRVVRLFWHGLRKFIRTVLSLPPLVRVIAILALLFFLWFGLNWSYHVFHKPSETLFPFARSLNKRPVETWKQYETLFHEHATSVITPEFLAALAQVEGGGNPIARTYWRWKLTWNPLEWYQPASSAVGMFQITDGTFLEATHYCIHDHVVVEDGLWHDLQSCWFNSLYTRVVPSHAIEMTAALLDRRVTELLGTQRLKTPLQQKQDLAALIHLCGAGAGRAYTARGLKLSPHQQCGDHDVGKYLARINALKHGFSKPAARKKIIRRAH